MNIQILGIPMDLGAGRRGVDMGPSALRNARLAHHLQQLGHQVTDLGDVCVPVPETVDKFTEGGYVFLEQVLETNRAIVERLRTLPDSAFPITIGGDHSMGIGTVAGNALRGNPSGHRMGLIWVDAHADFNTPETSPSGNIHGMPVAHLTGLGERRLASLAGEWRLRNTDIVMIGIRSVDEHERELLREHGVRVYTMKDIDQKGITRVTEETLDYLSDTERLHVSYDADALDPSVTPGTGTTVPGGLTYREGHLLMELLCDSGRVTSLDIVEVNPILDTRNKTAEVMVSMAASLLGQRIL
ncbi:arginase [Deinococcus lacus]|uniref:Arginase n=1 Tax=Deinococcus lacus TaxID=392561 RepID=A0ABW1YB28_9DEIO